MKTTDKKTNILACADALSTPAAEHEVPADVQSDPAEHKTADRRAFVVRLLTYLSVPFFIGILILYAVFRGGGTLLSLIAPAISLLFLAAATIRLIPYIVFKKDVSEPMVLGERSQKKLHPYIRIILFSLLAQLVVIIFAYSAFSIANGYEYLLPEGFIKLFAQPRGIAFGENTRCIAQSLGLASFVLPQHLERSVSNLAALIPALSLNTLSIAGAAVLLYELVICDHSKRTAKFSVLLMYFLPSVLLLMQPFSGTAPFFALSLLSLLLSRRKHIFGAGIAAFFASLFNVFAVLLIVPIALEWIIHSSGKRAIGEASESNVIKPGYASIGLLLAVLPAAAAVIIKTLGVSGLSAFEGEGAFSFNPIGRLLSEWNNGSIPRSMIVVSLCALVFLALLIFFGARSARTSHTAFALAFTLVPAVLSIDLTLYAVFALPILSSLIGEKCSFKPARFMIGAIAVALTVLFVIFLYIKRAA